MTGTYNAREQAGLAARMAVLEILWLRQSSTGAYTAGFSELVSFHTPLVNAVHQLDVVFLPMTQQIDT